jgi:hypothetical protein
LSSQSYLIGINTTYLVATPEECEGSPQENMAAVVSVSFVIPENDTQVTFDFGNTSFSGEWAELFVHGTRRDGDNFRSRLGRAANDRQYRLLL